MQVEPWLLLPMNVLDDPVMVEFIKADAGIDIGDTFIGMHMKHVNCTSAPQY